jgi:hypothetical protein
MTYHNRAHPPESEPLETHRFPARESLLDYVATLVPDLRQQIARDPVGWSEELGVIYEMLAGHPWTGLTGIDPPAEDRDDIGENAAIVSGKGHFYDGLWIKRGDSWTRYRVEELAVLKLSPQIGKVAIGHLLPENFTEEGELVKDNKRPIYRFTAPGPIGDLKLFAKGSVRHTSKYHPHAKPSHRKTSLATMDHIRPAEEYRRIRRLSALGVSLPRTFGLYTSLTEEWMYTEYVEGREIPDWLDKPKAVETIIDKDAKMLAALCRAGYRKQGFCDFDDKIFDGENLFLIDTEELTDLYLPGPINFRELLLDPNDESALQDFRNLQRELFMVMLKDAVFEYRNSLLDTPERATQYILTFFGSFGWDLDEDTLTSLLEFPDNYFTHDRFAAIMSDTD